MTEKQIKFLPRCPKCEARLPMGQLMSFDTKQIVRCEHCQSQLQIDMSMTITDRLLQVVVYVPLAIYGLFAALYLIGWLDRLGMTILIIWLMSTIILGHCIWRIYLPRITPWEPACLNCGYSLKGFSRNECPECGSAFDFADYQSLDPGMRLFFKVLRWGTLVSFVAMLVIGLIMEWATKGAVIGIGFPEKFMIHQINYYKMTDQTAATDIPRQWSWYWTALCDDLFLSLFIGFIVALIFMRFLIRKRHRQGCVQPNKAM
jgi:transposase-like protein